MDEANTDIVDERDALIASLLERQKLQDKKLAAQEKQLQAVSKKNDVLSKSVEAESRKIQTLEERLLALLAKQYGKSSERFNPNQLSFLNEAEVTEAAEAQNHDNESGVTSVQDAVAGLFFAAFQTSRKSRRYPA